MSVVLATFREMAKGKKEIKKIDEADVMKKLGARIRQLRIAKGYTSQEIFAYEHDLNRVQYSRYERGEDLRFSTLIKVIQIFDMSVEEFFSEGFE